MKKRLLPIVMIGCFVQNLSAQTAWTNLKITPAHPQAGETEDEGKNRRGEENNRIAGGGAHDLHRANQAAAILLDRHHCRRVSCASLTNVRAISQHHTVRDVPRPGYREDGVSKSGAQLLIRVPERKDFEKPVEHIAHLEARRTVPHSTVFCNYGSVQHNHRQ